MSSNLLPLHQSILAIRSSIQSTLKTDLPPDTMATVISPMLAKVNLWSTQIPAMFEGAGTPSPVNLVFAIRKDLFVSPAYAQSTLGIPLPNLPPEFQEFATFIHLLIDAQKVEKEKSSTKVTTPISKSCSSSLNRFQKARAPS